MGTVQIYKYFVKYIKKTAVGVIPTAVFCCRGKGYFTMSFLTEVPVAVVTRTK